MGNLQVSDIHNLKLEREDGPFHSSKASCFTLPLPRSGSLNITIKDDLVYNMSYLRRLYPRHSWRNITPKNMSSNYWITQVEDDESITSEHVTEAVQFLRDEGVAEINIELIKCSVPSSTNVDLRSKLD